MRRRPGRRTCPMDGGPWREQVASSSAFGGGSRRLFFVVMRPKAVLRDLVRFVVVCFFAKLVTSQRQDKSQTPGGLEEYCQWESFNASCGSDQVMLMQTARYGRMRFGRCMREDHGSSGCSAVVLPLLDQLCSGRRSCVLNIPDATLHSIHPCPKELMPYLEASYTCVTVKSGSLQACALFGGQPLPPDTGYLASVTSSETGVGSVNCPWMIEAQSGHKVNLTLYGFSMASPTAGAGGAAPPPDPKSVPAAAAAAAGTGAHGCPWTIVVRESNLTVQLPGCTGASREQLVYTSHGGNVQVHLTQSPVNQGTSEPGPMTPILLRYKVFGCADMNGMTNALVKRYGETTIVRCISTGQTYILTCADNQWRGDVGNCTKVASAIESGQMELRNGGIPYGLLLVIGIGVVMGLLLGVLMLFAILFCLRKQRRKRSRSQTTDPLFQRVEFDDATSSVYLERRRTSSPLQQQGLCPYHHQLRFDWSPSEAHGGPVDLACTPVGATPCDHPAASSAAFQTLSLPFAGDADHRTVPRKSFTCAENARNDELRSLSTSPPPAPPTCRCHGDKTAAALTSADNCLSSLKWTTEDERGQRVEAEYLQASVGRQGSLAGNRTPPPPPPPPPPSNFVVREAGKSNDFSSPSPVLLDLIRDSVSSSGIVPQTTDATVFLSSRHLHSIAESPGEMLLQRGTDA